MDARTFVIVGANLTGGAAATTLRTDGFDGRIVMIGDEPHPPYERPPMSKDHLRGETALEDAYLHPPAWYPDNGVDLLLGERATDIDADRKLVELKSGERIGYDRLLIATGGRNRPFPAPGGDLDGVLRLRTVEDSDRIRAEAARSRTVAVVGAGFIGTEVAASLRALGQEVDLIDPSPTPLHRVVGDDVGRAIESVHRDHGVRFHLGGRVERLEGSNGRVERVVMDTGEAIGCDYAVVGVGIQPNVEVAATAGVEVDNGIVVDAQCRTSVRDIFAAGDVANHDHPIFGRRLRVEHYDNALKQGSAVARAMLLGDAAPPFDDTHWFWSDQYEVRIEYGGFAFGWDEVVFRGSLEDRNFTGFYLQEGVVAAVVAMNRGKDVRRSVGLIRAQRPVDPAALRDPGVDLKKLGAALVGASD